VKDEADAKAAYAAYVKIYPDDLKPSLAGCDSCSGELAKTNPRLPP